MSVADKLKTIAEKQQEVYDAGYAKGLAQGGDSTYFWEVFQNGGQRTSYGYAFYQWDGAIFNPKYDIRPTGQYGADSMFFGATNIDDLDALLNSKGIVLDFSNTSRLNSTFQRCSASKLPVINLTNCKNMTLSFQNMSYLTKLTLNNLSADCTFDRVFVGTNLTELDITGTIGQNGFDVSSCRLSADSINDILIDNLQDKSGDTSGTEWKITLGSTNKNKASATALADAEAKGWVIV